MEYNLYGTPFQQINKLVEILKLNQDKVIVYWLKQSRFMSDERKCEELQKHLQALDVEEEIVLQNWIENRQIPLSRLKEIIQDEEKRRKEQSCEKALEKKREDFISKVDFIKLSAKNISEIKPGMFWYAANSVASTYIPPQMVSFWKQELMAVVVYVDTENSVVYGDTIDKIDWETTDFANAQQQVSSKNWLHMDIHKGGFKLPQIELLQKIGDNCKLVNPILQKNKLPVFSGDYWSSSLNSDSSKGCYIHLDFEKDNSQTKIFVGYDDVKKEKQAHGLISMKLQ